MYPTLEMAKTTLKIRRCDNKNYVFWMGLGFRNSGCGGLGFWRAEFWAVEVLRVLCVPRPQFL